MQKKCFTWKLKSRLAESSSKAERKNSKDLFKKRLSVSLLKKTLKKRPNFEQKKTIGWVKQLEKNVSRKKNTARNHRKKCKHMETGHVSTTVVIHLPQNGHLHLIKETTIDQQDRTILKHQIWAVNETSRASNILSAKANGRIRQWLMGICQYRPPSSKN